MNGKTMCGLLTAILLVGCDGGRAATQGKEAIQAIRHEVQEEVAKVKLKESRSGEWSPELTDEEKQTLFAIVEDTLHWCIRQQEKPFAFDGYTITPKLKKKMATFVTLKADGMLRGCIGSLAPVEALYASVHNNAINASMRDLRFHPVTEKELEGLEVHISILSPIEDIPSIDAFKIGEHGIIIEKGMHRAVYLPEVAVEQDWTVEETLSSLSQKAGMNAEAWRKGSTFKVFSSVVLSEE